MKILAIGCSFTNYCWPTWADFLDADNYGLSGIGNDRMFYRTDHEYGVKSICERKTDTIGLCICGLYLFQKFFRQLQPLL